MPLAVNFNTSQPIGQPGMITITDTTTGSDVAVVSRRVYFRTATGTFLVEEGNSSQYELFPDFPTMTNETYDVLTKDYALTLTVEWLDNSSTVLYSLTKGPIGFKSYNEDWDYQLTQMASGNPMLINDDKFMETKSNLRTYIDSGDNAILNATDIFGAQQCYDLATQIRINSPYFFQA